MSVTSDKSDRHYKNYQRSQMRVSNEDLNPCLKEANLSKECLERNLYARELCSLHYDNYNNCKKFWASVRLQRKIAGIKPHLPEKEEREKIMESMKKDRVSSVS